jgi:hypothetical protein
LLFLIISRSCYLLILSSIVYRAVFLLFALSFDLPCLWFQAIPSALRDVTMEVDPSGLAEVPRLLQVTVKNVGPATHLLGRVCLITYVALSCYRAPLACNIDFVFHVVYAHPDTIRNPESASFCLLAARQGDVFYPVLTEGNFRGELQALAPFDASSPITLRVCENSRVCVCVCVCVCVSERVCERASECVCE